MATVEQSTETTQQCPFVRYEDVNPAHSAALWHFDNIDDKRRQAPVYFGDAAGHEFWMLTRMADIRAAFQRPEVFSSRAVVPYEPEPPYMWDPGDARPVGCRASGPQPRCP